MDELFISQVEEALRAEGLELKGPLIEGKQRHNGSLSDGSSIFVKVLGSTNTSDAFTREIGMAKLLPYAPKPLLEWPLDVAGTFITAWEHVEGNEITCERANEEDATKLVLDLFEIYAIPTEKVRFHVDRLTASTIERRLHVAYIEDKIPASLLKDVETAVRYHAFDFLDSATAMMMREDTVIHGDPHMGNMLKSANGTSRLIDYESVKRAPLEYDLATMFQDLSQINERDDLWVSSYNLFVDMMSYTMGRDVDELLLKELILFKNAQTLTYLIAFGDWDVVASRTSALLEAVKTEAPPERLQKQAGL